MREKTVFDKILEIEEHRRAQMERLFRERRADPEKRRKVHGFWWDRVLTERGILYQLNFIYHGEPWACDARIERFEIQSMRHPRDTCARAVLRARRNLRHKIQGLLGAR
jgi:hypothetical protein